MVTAKAICFKEAMTPEFQDYAHQIVKNSKVLAERLMARGIKVVTGGTDNHIVLIDVSPLGLTGRQAEQILEDCGIVTNRNSLPNDPNGAWYTSGIRLGAIRHRRNVETHHRTEDDTGVQGKRLLHRNKRCR